MPQVGLVYRNDSLRAEIVKHAGLVEHHAGKCRAQDFAADPAAAGMKLRKRARLRRRLVELREGEGQP